MERLYELNRTAEAARQSEKFKATLLDAVAHEFKTPLTSIKAATSTIQALHPQSRPNKGTNSSPSSARRQKDCLGS